MPSGCLHDDSSQMKAEKFQKKSVFLAEPGMIEATFHSKWPSRGLSHRAPDAYRQACLGTGGRLGPSLHTEAENVADREWAFPNLVLSLLTLRGTG